MDFCKLYSNINNYKSNQLNLLMIILCKQGAIYISRSNDLFWRIPPKQKWYDEDFFNKANTIYDI